MPFYACSGAGFHVALEVILDANSKLWLLTINIVIESGLIYEGRKKYLPCNNFVEQRWSLQHLASQ